MHIENYFYMEDLPIDCIRDCSHSGSCDDDVEFWVNELDFTVDPDNARRYIESMGIEDTDQMSDSTLAEYILWMACNDFSEQLAWQEENPDKPAHESSYGTDLIDISSY